MTVSQHFVWKADTTNQTGRCHKPGYSDTKVIQKYDNTGIRNQWLSNLPGHSAGGTWWCSWLRHCATSRKVAGSIPDGVIGIFHWHNPSGRTTVLRFTQPQREMSTRNISWECKGSRCVRLTTLPLSCDDCLEICEPQPPGILRVSPGLLWYLFTYVFLPGHPAFRPAMHSV